MPGASAGTTNRVIPRSGLAAVAGPGGDQQAVRNRGVLDEELAAVDREHAAPADRPYVPDPRGVPAGAGFRQGERRQQVAAGDLGKEIRLLLLRPGVEDGGTGEHHCRDQRPWEQGPARLLDYDAEVQQVAARSPKLLREGQPKPAEVGQLPPEVRDMPRGRGLRVTHVAKRALPLQELPGAAPQHLLRFGEP